MKRKFMLSILTLIFTLTLAACAQTPVTPVQERVIETVVVTQVVDATEVVVVVPTEEPTSTPEPAPEGEAEDVTPTPTLPPGYAGLVVINAAGDELGTVETTVEGPEGTNYVVVNTGENLVPVPEPAFFIDQENSLLMFFQEESLLAEAPSFANVDEIDQAALDASGEVSSFWSQYFGTGS